MKNKTSIVMNALRTGLPVTLQFDEIKLELVMQDDKVGVVSDREDTKTGKKDKVFLPLEIDLSNFMKACNKINDQDAFILSATTAFNNFKKGE